jgi:hypothetical protein
MLNTTFSSATSSQLSEDLKSKQASPCCNKEDLKEDGKEGYRDDGFVVKMANYED